MARESSRQIEAKQMQALVLRYLAGYVEQHGHAPSYAAMAAALKLSAKSIVWRAVQALEGHGDVRRLSRRACGIELLTQPDLPRAPDGAPLYFIPAERLARSVSA